MSRMLYIIDISHIHQLRENGEQDVIYEGEDKFTNGNIFAYPDS